MFATPSQPEPLSVAGLTSRTPAAPAAVADRGQHGLALGLLIFAAVAVRLLVFVLGPMGAIELAATEHSAMDLSVGMAVAEEASLQPFVNQAHLHAPGVDSPPLALPGYPLLIAGLHALGLPLIALLLLQVAMGGAATWLAYAAADGLLNSRRCGLIAAAVVGLHPASVLASVTLAPDALFMLLLLAAVALVAPRSRHDFAGSLLGGLCLGAAILVKPLTLLAGAAIGAWMIVSGRRWSSVGAAVVFTIMSLVPIGAWAARNHVAGLEWWPHPTSAWTGAADDAAIGDPLATIHEMQQRAPAFFASHGVHDLFTRLGLSAPEGVEPVVLLPLMEPARLLAVRDVPTGLALAWTAGNVLLLAATILGAVLLLVRGRLSALLLAATATAYFLWAWNGQQAEMARLPGLGLQATLAAAVALPGLGAFLEERRRKAAERRRLHAEAEAAPEPEPVVVRSGRPI